MGWAEDTNQGEGEIPDNGQPDERDQHTKSAAQMVLIMLGVEQAIRDFRSKPRLLAGQVDVTPMILDALSAQSRTLAFILDELLAARGERRSITFREKPEEERSGPRLVVDHDSAAPQ